MTYNLSILDEAQEDAKQSAIWYNEQKAELGRRFKGSLYTIIDKIHKNPLHFGRRYLEIRAAKVEKFPFKVFFVVDGQEIIVIAILHDSRNPQIWKSRTL